MERELMPDNAAEAFYRYLIPPSVFEGAEEPKEKFDPRVIFCMKKKLNLLDKNKGAAVVLSDKNFFSDETCLVTPAAKAVVN